MNNGTVKFGAKSMGYLNTIDVSGSVWNKCNGDGTEKNIEMPAPKNTEKPSKCQSDGGAGLIGGNDEGDLQGD